MSTFRAQVIHSGHFMTTHVHNDDPAADDDDEDIEVDVVEDDDKSEEASSGSTDKNKALDEKPVTFYKFGPTKTQSIAIDVSLNKLNKCIKVAYNKMTTPKWKDFKGLRLHWKQRIRLNNVIWRAYYIEFRKKTPAKPKKPFCYFAVPDDDTTHQKIEGSILEGMYWKRRMEAVCAQYKRWRIRSRHNIVVDRGMIHTSSSASVVSLIGDRRKRKNKEHDRVKFLEPPVKLQRSQTPKHSVSEEWALDFDDLNNVFTDELFDSLSQPYAFPNPREFGQSGNADIMQPGLLPLQPTIEEIMASLADFPDSPPGSEPMSPSTSAQNIQRDRMMHTQQQSVTSGAQIRRSNSSSASLHHHAVPPPQQPAQTPSTSGISQNNQFMNKLTNYNLMPTRQSSAITSQMLMLSQSAPISTSSPLYSTSSHFTANNSFLPTRNVMVNPNHNQWKQSNNFLVAIPASNPQSHVERLLNSNSSSSSSDPYMPQFLQSPPSNAIPDPALAPSRSWWLDSPLTASVQSPLSVATPLPLANQNQLAGPHTPLGHLMGGSSGESGTSPAGGFLIGHNMLMETANRNLRVGGSTLAQRLEQPSIVATHSHLFGSSDKVIKPFTPLYHQQSPQQQQSNNQFDLSRITRIRSSEGWKVAQVEPTPLTTPPVVPIASSALISPSAFGSPSVSSNTMTDISDSKPPTTSVTQDISQLTMVTRQSSCDPAMLASSLKNEQKGSEAKNGRQFDRKELSVTKEESPQLMSAPSSVKSMRRQVPDSTLHPEERKRILHLHAEQNRRSALKDGFDQLMEIIPDLYSGGVKPTNAVVLAKAADHIRRLQREKWEKEQSKEEAKAKIERLNQRIASLQLNLPASSTSSVAQIDSKTSLETFFDRYVKESSKNDWRFWVMSNMLKPLCVGKPNSFSSCVAGDGASRQEIAASCSDWLNANWKVMELRPFASSLLVHLATNTNMLTNPNSLKDYVEEQLKNPY